MVHLGVFARKKLGELLVEQGVIKEEQLQQALRQQKVMGGLLGESLVELGYVTETDLTVAIALQYGLPFVDLDRFHVSKNALALVPPDFLVQNRLLVLDRLGKTLLVAAAGNLEISVFEEIEKMTGLVVYPCISHIGQMREAHERFLSASA